MLARIFGPLLDLVLPPTDAARTLAGATDLDIGRLASPTITTAGVTALLPYRHRLVRAAVLEAKYNGSQHARALLARVLADHIAALVEESAAFEPLQPIIVPIPLGILRRRDRGYNQIEEVVRAASMPVSPLLIRTRETHPQTSLPRRERLQNVAGAFAARAPLDPDAAYILLDDVVTTGATLAAGAEALRAAGATRVIPLALAHS